MARQVEAAFEECREQINQADLLKMTDWYIEFGFICKVYTSTNLQDEIEDKDKDKKTTDLPDWDKVIYDIVQTNSHRFSVKYSQISDIIGKRSGWMWK